MNEVKAGQIWQLEEDLTLWRVDYFEEREFFHETTVFVHMISLDTKEPMRLHLETIYNCFTLIEGKLSRVLYE